MPFLPFVLLIAWQALSRSASFALGWATTLFFGHVPGSRGRVLSIMGLLAAAWVALLIGWRCPSPGAGWRSAADSSAAASRSRRRAGRSSPRR